MEWVLDLGGDEEFGFITTKDGKDGYFKLTEYQNDEFLIVMIMGGLVVQIFSLYLLCENGIIAPSWIHGYKCLSLVFVDGYIVYCTIMLV